MRIVIKILMMLNFFFVTIAGSYVIDSVRDNIIYVNVWILIMIVAIFAPVFIWLSIIQKKYQTLDEKLEEEWIDTIDGLMEYMDEVVIDSIDKGFSLAYSEWSKKYIQFFIYDFEKGIRWQSDEFKINLINFITK